MAGVRDMPRSTAVCAVTGNAHLLIYIHQVLPQRPNKNVLKFFSDQPRSLGLRFQATKINMPNAEKSLSLTLP